MDELYLSVLKRISCARLTVFIAGMLLSCCGYAQPYYNRQANFINANSTWAFGEGAGLDFNSGGPVSVTTAINTVAASAAASDPATGQLLFYTNGMESWNANHQLMPNGTLMVNTDTFSTLGIPQGTCIVPVIDSPGKYYVFSLARDMVTNYGASLWKSLYYSMVDMSLASGLGDVVPGKKNIPLNTGTKLSESMLAIPGNNCDIWLMVHAYGSPEFMAYHITREGLDTVPVISTTGFMLQDTADYEWGTTAVSSDRRLLATTSFNYNYWIPPLSSGTILAQFDPSTGIVSNGTGITGDSLWCDGVCFSPDNSRLYVSMKNYLFEPVVYQFNVSVFDSATIVNSAIPVFEPPQTFIPQYFKLYNDTIYTPKPSYGSIHRINKPNLAGAACDFEEDALSLLPSSNYTNYALPNDVVYPLPPDTATGLLLDTLICSVQNGYNLHLTALPGYDAYVWDDGSTSANRTITALGSYWVLCKDRCHSRIDTFIIGERATTPFSLGNDTLLCSSQVSMTLEVSIPGAVYLWQDGSTGGRHTAKEAGTYWVAVSENGCKNSDTVRISTVSLKQDLGPDIVLCTEEPVDITLTANAPIRSEILWNTGSQQLSITASDTGYYWVAVNQSPCFGNDTVHITSEICDCSFLAPTAFTPNGDGLNDELLPQVVPGCRISSFMFSVYNRYGQRVFQSMQPDKGWDGTFQGSPADVGAYFFELSFKGGRDNNNYSRKGDVTLIR